MKYQHSQTVSLFKIIFKIMGPINDKKPLNDLCFFFHLLIMKHSVITCHNLENCDGWNIIVALPVFELYIN